MKTLDTLIEDIYSKLDGLSNGEPLNISEEDIDLALSGMKESIMHWSQPSERNKNFTLRMSNIGRPVRQLWFEKNDDSGQSVPSAATQIKFLYGHILEEIALMLVRMAGHEVTDIQKEVNVDGILGHMDCKINGEVVDVKTASKFSFNKFRNGTLAENDSFGYLSQLAGYEEAEGTSNGGFLVINKESGELCLFRPEDHDKPKVVKKIKNIKHALDLDTPPEKCYDPIPDGKKGNMKLPTGCTFCAYKYKCHADANDGEGLRTFKYANGLAYLTKVVSTPNVDEVL